MSSPSNFGDLSFQWEPPYKYLVKVNSSQELPLEVKQRFLNTFSRELSSLQLDGKQGQVQPMQLTIRQQSAELQIYLSMQKNLGSHDLEHMVENCLVQSMGRKLHSGMHDYYVEIKVVPELRAGC